jgi:cholesterol transport system auxiliary component
MSLTDLVRRMLLAVALASLAGCGAFSAVSGATEELDAYTPGPLIPEQRTAGVAGHLIVEEPTAPGAIATDRILIKPNRIQAQYLSGARWIDPAPVLIQTLLLQSLENSGGFRLVGRQAMGLMPDYTLMTEIRDFQAEAAPADEGRDLNVRIALTLTLIRETDRSILATRRVESVVATPSSDPVPLVSAFDAALSSALLEVITWTIASVRRGAS